MPSIAEQLNRVLWETFYASSELKIQGYLDALLQDGNAEELTLPQWNRLRAEIRFVAGKALEDIDVRQIVMIAPDALFRMDLPARTGGTLLFTHTLEGEVRKALYVYLQRTLEAFVTAYCKERQITIAPEA